MNVQVPRLTRALPLSEYAPELGEASLHVWVNPTRAHLEAHARLVQRAREAASLPPDKMTEATRAIELVGRELADLHPQLWSQHPDAGTHWTQAEVLELYQADPALYEFATRRSHDLIAAHREDHKKK